MDAARTFTSYEVFQETLKIYSKNTFQTFTTKRSKKYSDHEKERKTLVFSELVLKCVHLGNHNWKGTGQRPIQHTRQIDCPVFIRLAGSKKTQLLIVKEAPDVKSHNHELTETNWMNERENRLLTTISDNFW
jgi:hypothetical protein